MNRILKISAAAMFCLTTAGTALLAQDADKKSTQDKDAKSAQTTDVLKDAVDPFSAGKERARFLKAAGVDTELDAEEAKANAKVADGFIRPFDKWSNLLLFDRNKDKKIDWFEANAYRRAVRAAVLAVYDKDGNKKLTGEEREKANKDLSAGKLPKISATKASTTSSAGNNLPEPRRGSATQGRPSGNSRTFGNRGGSSEERRAEFLKKYDKDGSGELSDEERRDGFRAEIEARRQRSREENPERAAEEDKRRAEFLKKYDKDGDGELSREERSAGYRAEGETRRAEFTKKYDKDGNGELSDEERRAGFRAEMQERMERFRQSNPDRAAEFDKRREEFMKQYDTNGDGELDEKEREAIRERFQGRRGRSRGGDGNRDGNRGGEGRPQRRPSGDDN